MNNFFAFKHLGRACAPALAGTLAAVLAAPACAGEPAVLRAEDLGALPCVDVSTRSPAVPGVKAQGARLAVGGDTIEALDLEQLEPERGRAGTVVNDTRLGGEVANNSAVNVNTGANMIDAGSFANMSGIPVVIQNSGANVLIQNATVINLQFQ